MKPHKLLGIAISLLITSCAADRAHPSHLVYEGLYIVGYETTSFDPCDNDEVWWFAATGETGDAFFREIEKIRENRIRKSGAQVTGKSYPVYFVRVEGEITEKGSFGHLGGYDREIIAHKILKIRIASRSEIAECSQAPHMRNLGDLTTIPKR